jgi:hypothetical protein
MLHVSWRPFCTPPKTIQGRQTGIREIVRRRNTNFRNSAVQHFLYGSVGVLCLARPWTMDAAPPYVIM